MKEHQKVAHGAKSVCHNNKKNHAMGSQDPGSKKKKTYTDGGAEKGKIGKMLAAVGACNEEGALDHCLHWRETFRSGSLPLLSTLSGGACPNMTASHNSLSAVVIVWDGVTAMGHTLLVFVPKGTKIDTDLKEILESHLLPWSQSHFGKQFWKLQQNSAPAPKSKKSQQWCHTNMPKFTPSEEQLQNYSRT